MLQKLKNKIMFLMKRERETSKAINEKIVKKFTSNPEFPWLVSFPRTGSHWLRMIMELYFEKPALVRAFYYFEAKDFTCIHTHDIDLSLKNVKNVIYLYREPDVTIFSQMKYYDEDLNDKNRVKYWAQLYGSHLSKWLIEEKFTKTKAIIKYERLKNDFYNEFRLITDFFGQTLDLNKLEKAKNKVSKKEVKLHTKHDEKVVTLSNDYEKERALFLKQFSNFIYEIIYNLNPKLKEFIGK